MDDDDCGYNGLLLVVVSAVLLVVMLGVMAWVAV